jgi:hypothetical protein
MPGSWSGGKDSAAWILVDIGILLLALLLQWSEGRVEGRTDAPFNKGVAVYHLVLRNRGGRQLFLAGLGGEGKARARRRATSWRSSWSAVEARRSAAASLRTRHRPGGLIPAASGVAATRRSCFSRPTVAARERRATVLLRCTGSGAFGGPVSLRPFLRLPSIGIMPLLSWAGGTVP